MGKLSGPALLLVPGKCLVLGVARARRRKVRFKRDWLALARVPSRALRRKPCFRRVN